MTSRSTSRIAIFDLDRTLIRCDSFPTLLNSLLLRNWWRLTATVLASPVLLLFWASARTRTASLSALLWLATVGMRDEEWAAAVSSQARQLASDTMNVVNRDGLRTLKEHQRHGDQVVLVTGSWCDLASALCTALGSGRGAGGGLDPACPHEGLDSGRTLRRRTKGTDVEGSRCSSPLVGRLHRQRFRLAPLAPREATMRRQRDTRSAENVEQGAWL